MQVALNSSPHLDLPVEERMKLSDVKHLNAMYWFIIVVYHCALIPSWTFTIFGISYLQEEYPDGM